MVMNAKKHQFLHFWQSFLFFRIQDYGNSSFQNITHTKKEKAMFPASRDNNSR